MNNALASIEFAAVPRSTKGLYCSPLFDMFIQYQYKLQLHQSGRATLEARSSSIVVGLTKASRQQKIVVEVDISK